MSTSRNYLIGFLALTTVGGAILAWQQYGELVELRASAMNRDERADNQQRIASLERLNRELQDQLAAARGSDGDPLSAGDAGERQPDERGRRGDRPRGPEGRGSENDPRRQQEIAMRELMAKPEIQAMLSQQQKAAVEARYAALFKNLNLTAEQAEKLKTLLADRGNTRRDIDEAARAQGINPRENPEAFRKLFTDAQDQLNSSIKSVIGEQGFAQLQNYEQTLPQRNLVESLQQRLSNTGMPLTPTQTEQLIQILASNSPSRATATTTGGTMPTPGGPPIAIRGGPGGGFAATGPVDFVRGGPDGGRVLLAVPGMGGGGPLGTAAVTPTAVAQAQTILAPPQVEALQKIQQLQQSQQQLQQIIRETLSNATPAGAARPPGPAPRKGGGG